MYKFVRYVISGGLATLTSLVVAYILTDVLQLWYVISTALGFCIALSISFVLQKFWTFRRTEMERVHVEATQFAMVAIGGLLFNTLFVYVLVEYVHLHYLLAQICSGALIAVANFFCYRFIFREAENSYLREIQSREVFVFFALLVAFIAVRIGGLNLPFHQDEMKIAEVVEHQIVGGLNGHPPLNELIYRWSGYFVDANHLRLVPLVFGIISAVLLYLIVRRRAGVYAAITSLALYVICAYSVLASLMIDFDGAILPTFFLLAVYAYDRFQAAPKRQESWAWLCAVGIAVLLGFLTKLSFVIVLGALVLDYVFSVRDRLNRAILLRIGLTLLACLAVVLVAILGAHVFLPAFHDSQTLSHALSYVRFGGRGYLQILIQTLKALFYLSPLLLAPLIFASRDALKKNRIFISYLALGAIFYLVLFDFSQGALDKYLMFSIVPFCALVGTIIVEVFRDISRPSVTGGLLIGFAASLLLVALNFLSPAVMPLYPKTAWVHAVATGNWNILMPFTGGSGPLGFYVSFLVIAAGFAISVFFGALGKMVPQLRSVMLVALIVVGVTFNGIFIEELIFGRINGSAPTVLQAALAYIAHSDSNEIITHADAGAFELKDMGKYSGRFYAVPGYEEGHKALFAKFTGDYLVVNIPLWGADSFYAKYFSSCTSVFHTTSGAISADVYTCPVGVVGKISSSKTI